MKMNKVVKVLLIVAAVLVLLFVLSKLFKKDNTVKVVVQKQAPAQAPSVTLENFEQESHVTNGQFASNASDDSEQVPVQNAMRRQGKVPIPDRDVRVPTNQPNVTEHMSNMDSMADPLGSVGTTHASSGELVGVNAGAMRGVEQQAMSCFPADTLTAEDLLPQDNNSIWAQINPAGCGTLKDKNFLQAGYNIGINTVGQTLRNANHQLRSDPPAPQIQVSPWLQSTIDPDVNRRPLEIGGCM